MRSVDRINMLQMEEQSRSDRNIRSVQILSFVQNYIYETGMIPYKSCRFVKHIGRRNRKEKASGAAS